jgi:hypothetical protein
MFEQWGQNCLDKTVSTSASESVRQQAGLTQLATADEGMQLDSVKRKRRKKMKKHKWKKRSKVLRRQTKASRGAKK